LGGDRRDAEDEQEQDDDEHGCWAGYQRFSYGRNCRRLSLQQLFSTFCGV
jgi:hypothetical protein